MTRYRAAAWHVSASLLAGLVVLAGVLVVWYPGVFGSIAARRQLVFLAGAVLVGPLCTLMVFKPGKWGLRFDLVVIALLQVCAITGAAWLLFATRPVYITFVKDRFEVVRANEFPAGEWLRGAGSPFEELPVDGPKLAGARMPTDPAERQRIAFLGPSGIDLQHMPRHYVAYEEVRAEVRARDMALDGLRRLNPAKGAEIDALVARLGRGEADLRFLPLRAAARDFAAIVDAQGGDLLEIVELRPWE